MPTDKPTLAALLCALPLLAGCTTTTPGVAVQSSPVDGLFVSCDIPDDALVAAGLDPATERVGFVGEQFTHAKLCSWDGPWYHIGIFAMADTIEQIISDPEYTGVRSVTINDRKAVLFQRLYDPREKFCFIGYTTAAGTILLHGIDHSGDEDGGDICATLTETALALDDHIPQ